MSINTNEWSDIVSTNSLGISDLTNSSSHTQLSQTTDEANNKYEKLVQDYVKLRSKLVILKKAYVELSDSSSQKDKSLRKYEQELEGLNFRNQQLTGRVENLQKELDRLGFSVLSQPVASQIHNHTQQTANTALSAATEAHTQLEVLTEELGHKINENASLHRRVHELEIDFELNITSANKSLQTLEAANQELIKKFETAERTSKSLIEKLQNDKIKLELNLAQREEQLKAVKHADSDAAHSSITNPRKPEQTIESPKLKAKTPHLNMIQIQTDSLMKLYSYLDERNSFLISEDRNLFFSACEQLFSQKLSPCIRTFLGNASNPSGRLEFDAILQDFFKSNENLFKKYFTHYDEHFLTDLNLPTSDEIELLNKKLSIYLNKLCTVLFNNKDAVSSHELLEQLRKFEISTSTTRPLPSSVSPNQQPDFKSLLIQLFNYVLFDVSVTPGFDESFMHCLKAVYDLLEKILFVLNEKLSVEYSLEYPSELTMLDECIVSYLTQLKSSMEQLLQSFSTEFGVIELADSLIKNINPKKPAESDDKDKQFKQANDQIQLLNEQILKDSDHVERLEFKLNQMQDLVDQLQGKEHEYKSLIAQLETNQMKNGAADNLESLRIDFYMKKIDSLNQQIQTLDSKAIFYYEEMKAMLERLKLHTETNNMLEAELNEVKDQLERTRSSYEIQMSTMSEHLIEITDRMNRQEEENERLKYELNAVAAAASNVNGKSGKSKKSK